MEINEEQTRYAQLAEMKIKAVLVRLFTQQGVRDELLAKADGVEYISKGGSSLTVITRSKSQLDMTSRKSGELDWGTSGSQSVFPKNNTNGEMRLPDDDEMLDNRGFSIGKIGMYNPAMGLGDISPIKSSYYDPQQEPLVINPIVINHKHGPMGIGGNELPGIFNHKPKIDPRMMITPSKANNVAYPRV